MIKDIKKLFFNKRKASRYKDYDVDAFLKDEFFKNWVRYNDLESKHFWEKWLAKNPEKTKEVLKAKEIICSIDYKNKVAIENEDYLDMYEKIREQAPSFHKKPYKLVDLFSLKNVAAVLIIGILSFSGVKYFQEIGAEEKEKVVQSKLLMKQTQAGNKLSFYLSDGTKVKLNSSSTLTFPSVFQDSIREVYLKGEAYFEVSEDKEKPFIVKSEHLEARVLGTSFNFKTDSKNQEIALVSGKLKVSDASGNSIMLSPSQMVTYEERKLEKQHFDSFKKIAWVDGIIFFDSANGEEIFSTLEAWYGVEIKLEQGYQFKGKFSGSFKNEPLVNILKVVGKASGFNYELKGNQVLINSKK